MRVALLTHNARAGDAIGNQVAEKLTFFLERGADVRVLLESERNLHPAIAPHWQRLDHAQPAGQGWQFLATADLAVVEYSQYYSLLELLPLIALGKPRILFDYHGVTPAGLWENHHREALEKGARQRGLAWFADSVLAHSEFTRRDLQASGLPTERLHVLAHPLDLGRFTPGRPRRHLLQVLGLGEATLLLFVGRLAPNKRVPLLVEALSRLGGRTPAVHLAVLGDTSDIYEAEAERCRQVAAS